MSRRILLSTVILVLLGLGSNVLADPNLVGYWTFDDQSASDSSGNGYDGTLTGDAAVVSDGDRGYVLELDGDGDYVNLGNGSWTNPGDHMTVAAWIKVDAFNASYQTIVAKGNQTYRLSRNYDGDVTRVYMNYTSSSYKSAIGDDNVNDGGWHHVAATYDGTAIKFYVDGQLDGTNTLSTLYTNSDPLCIGRNSDQTSRDWQGCIDDVRFYNRALDVGEISDLYLVGVADPNMLGEWTFDDDTANDSSGYYHSGTLEGNAAIVTDGERGKVLELDGDGDYVDLGNGDWTNPGDNMSISAWVKVDSFNAAYQCVMAKGNHTFRLQRAGTSNNLRWYLNYNSTSFMSAIGDISVNDGNWHHVAGTFDGDYIELYIDGVLDDTQVCTTLYTNSHPLMIGRNSEETSRDWQGWIDDVRLYKKVLTLAEINALAELDCTISGSVGLLDGVTMSGLPGDPVTSGGGAYSATVGYGWDGTVTPTKAGYTFSPTSEIYSNVTADATSEDYTPTLNTYVISGSVGSLDGVTMGGLPGTPVTSGGGAYSATVDYGWDGTVTPTKAGYTFSPTNKTYSNVTANDTDEDYTPTLNTYVISGSIVDVDAMYDMDDVTMSGLPDNPVTDANGGYSATVTYGWSGTVTPSRAGFTFEPSSWEYDNVTADYNTPDCNATVIRYTVSGYVGTIAGVEFPDLACGATTDANGFYSCDVDYGWSGTVVPEANGYTFSPEDRSYSNVTSAQLNQDYTPIINTYTISGYVGTLDDVTMSGLPGSVVTSGGGAYSASVEYGWDGTVRPVLEGYVFEDAYRVYTDVDSNQTGQNYTPTLTAVDVNMLGWWSFNEGNVNDESGYGHHGILTGDANIIDDPIRGNVLHLDGDGDYVDLGNGDWTNPGDHMTIALWLKVDEFNSSYQTVIAKGLYTYRLGRTSGGDNLAAYIDYTASHDYRAAVATSNVNDGLWHHAAVTYDGTDMTIYVDGVQEGSNAVAALNADTANLCIGRNVDATDRDWEGLVDDVRLYDKVLTSAEIADLYTAENPDLVGWWKFDGDAKDSSGHGHHGTMVGDVAIVNDAEFGQVLQVSTGLDITDNWVDCGGGSGDRNWATLGNEMTVMAWVKTDSFTSEWQYIVTKGNSFMVGRYNVDAKLRFKTGHWTSVNLIGTTASDVTGGDWHHVAAVYDGASRYLYIDGQLNTSDNCTGMLEADDYNLLIGGYTGYNDRCWEGYIDDVKLFRRALSGTEVRVEAEMLAAEKPSPADGATDVELDQVLSWRAGPLADTAGGHDVYFGTSFEDVNSRDGSVFMGNKSETSYAPGMLNQLTTYYWVVDTNNDEYEDSPWAGEIWSFTTIDTNLVGFWNFDDGTASDSSENGYNGTLAGNAVIVNDTERGKVLQLDGDGDYINLGNGAWTNPGNNMTIAAWIKVSAFNASYQTVIAKGNQTYRLGRAGTSNAMRVYMNYDSSNYNSLGGSVNVNDGKWHHVLASYNGSAMKLYIDGQQDNSYTTLSKLNTNSDPLMIGRNSDQTGRDWQGKIDDVRFYNRALTYNEIRELASIYIAAEPSPIHKKVDVDTYPILSWKSAALAADTGGHDLYLGTNAELVAVRDASVYVGALDSNSYETDMLALATTYYWAVDEVNDLEPTSPWQGDVWMFQTRNSTEGYYMDIFTDGGAGVSGFTENDIGAINLLGYSHEHISTGDTPLTLKIMGVTDDGDWQDDNGVLLYPDREPRFRLMYCNGGHSGTHFTNLGGGGSWANNNVTDFYYNGGSYCGSCAGAWITASYRWKIAATGLGGCGIGGTHTDGTIPDGKTPWFSDGTPLPISPLLRENYYPEFFDDAHIHGINHNGGCRTNPASSNWDDSEALVLFDLTWTLKNEYVDSGDPADEQYAKDLTIYGTDKQKATHNKCMAWAHKHTDYTGRSAPCGSHPERRTNYGEETPLQSSLFQYASSGFGKHSVKAALSDGVTRQMNNNASAGHEKLGDKQYHQFTIEVPEGASQLQIVLDGAMYDFNLYAKLGDVAFKNEPGVISATNSTATDETLMINNPEAGTWYIGVKLNTTVTRTRTSAYYRYTGNFEVLNGIAYDITATVTE